jgi:hypothetical protein
LPLRFERLVLTSTFAKLEESDDHPFGVPHDVVSAGRALLIENWGNGATLDLLGLPHDEVARRRYAEFERSAITLSVEQPAFGARAPSNYAPEPACRGSYSGASA